VTRLVGAFLLATLGRSTMRLGRYPAAGLRTRLPCTFAVNQRRRDKNWQVRWPCCSNFNSRKHPSRRQSLWRKPCDEFTAVSGYEDAETYRCELMKCSADRRDYFPAIFLDNGPGRGVHSLPLWQAFLRESLSSVISNDGHLPKRQPASLGARR